ncbi:hypothetical protein [Desulfoscipio gibsoniae]|uniref:Uncharacterized protein n=1 Tax=Desulfoscipio gibsoniae DSM 7213 TaxID=767817 RepID=R4KJK4_9FIRM|nr:hypothetical protein [Desulfoscipio gibsoniae]AGL00705.1 hypothetical protein Desgi_1182 [Desulfoscipio gibsoniae DSM 7213]
MDPHDAHAEPAQEEFKMDYSEWQAVNIIPAIIFFGFLIGVSTIFI